MLRRNILLGACLSLLLSLPGTAALAETRVALVIGNSNYKSITPLITPANDAKLVTKSLREMGSEVTNLLDLTEVAMSKAVDQFASKAARADVAAVYFAGHGLQKDGENYLMPINADVRVEADIEKEGVSLSTITSALQGAPVSLLFLDACRNNPFAEEEIKRTRSIGTRSSVSRGLAVVRPVGDMLIAFATLPNTTAADGEGKNSPFAESLAKHITTPNVEVSVLLKRVNKDVITATNGDQRPQQLSQMQTEFYFAKTKVTQTPVIVETPEERALLTVYPHKAKEGEEISVVADLPNACTPFFFNFSPTSQLTPIPLKFFQQDKLSNGQTRYEISPGSRYGLVVTKDDANGENRFGYLCQPKGISDNSAIKSVLKEVVIKLKDRKNGGKVAAAGYNDIRFQVRPFEIYGN